VVLDDDDLEPIGQRIAPDALLQLGPLRTEWEREGGEQGHGHRGQRRA
jgi:hypothetical protein